jgi:hypothetical protein
MLTVKYSRTINTRDRILHHIKALKSRTPGYRVIDVGGTMGGGWSAPIVDLVVDLNASESPTSISLDLCDRRSWGTILRYVELHGMFNYAICTHTLEDLYNPFTALDLLPQIAKGGVISMPSLRTELSRVESASWLGYIHHRWVFVEHNGEMLVIPKLSMLEKLVGDAIQFKPEVEEIVYEWSDSIPYKTFMNNYLGPDARTVVHKFSEIINRLK